MLEKIKTLNTKDLITHLQDPRAVGLVIFGFIALLVTWSGVGAIETNYSLQNQINSLQKQNQLSVLQNANLQLQNQYYNTSEYEELQARALLGKGAPGEKLILVPKNVAMSELTNIPSEDTFTTIVSPPKPSYQSNFEAWVNFYFHRNQ